MRAGGSSFWVLALLRVFLILSSINQNNALRTALRISRFRFRALRTGVSKKFDALENLLGAKDAFVITEKFAEAGFNDADDVCSFAKDFSSRPEALSTILQHDFGFSPMESHRARAAIMQLLNLNLQGAALEQDENATPAQTTADQDEKSHNDESSVAPTKNSRKNMKKVAVNMKQASRHKRAGLESVSTSYAYGLTSSSTPASVAAELADFFSYMTELRPAAQEAPIRAATANVYCRHARLFLGWHLSRNSLDASTRVDIVNDIGGIFTAFPTKEKEGAKEVFDFVKWLRAERRISNTYEANIIRGLTKLAKYRFARESAADPDYGGKTFDDIPVVREMRKLHRQAETRRKISASRVSDEKKKWLEWPEYLRVVEVCWTEVEQLKTRLSSSHQRPEANLGLRKMVAVAFQQYLLLAFFAIVPDRQRTMRELEIGRTFVRQEGEAESADGSWSIVHSANDYKTGKSYGDRPPLPISGSLTSRVDEFIDEWRPCLQPQGLHLFVQTKNGGKPLTQDSVYQIVSRACYRHAGKRTNPHLLRDMVVTHVRAETNASEKDLEALALFMGHSLSMQKASYDRRTLDQKVAPAVALVQGLTSAVKR